jgi:predicted dehydrogenase
MARQERTSTLRDKRFSRRRFLGGAAAAVAGCSIVPRHVVGGAGHTPPSEKVNIAGIGVGGQGRSDLEELRDHNIVALCDVDWRRAAETFRRFPNAKRYKDFRRMLDKEKSIEAVVIATPDHTHAVAAMTAIKMGKHVYCEKPLTHTVHEARRLTEAAREHKIATQMGIQGHAGEGVRLLCEMIWDGAIGSVREVHSWTNRPIWPQGIGRPTDTPPVPKSLEWDLWLGPAPYRPYHPAYVPFKWRGWWDFGTGAIGDMGIHNLSPVFWALKLGHPTTVEASSTEVNPETYPLASLVRYEFPARGTMPPVELTWYDGGLMPKRPEELEEGRPFGDNDGGTLFVGDKGKMLAPGWCAADPRLIPETRMKEYEQPPKSIPRSIGHHAEWIEACKGGKPAVANFGFAGLLTEVVLLGNVAIRAGKKLSWDGGTMRVTNAPEANEYLYHQYRAGWSL